MFGAAAATTGILAQAPERGKDPQPGSTQPKREPAGKAPDVAMKPDPAVDAWVKVLLEKMTDSHDTVRDSARAGLVAVGRQAIPALQKLAEGDDGAKATAARKLIGEIHAREQRQPGFGNQPFPGGPGPGGFPDGSPPMPGGGRPGFPGGGGFNPGQPGQPGGQPGQPSGPLAVIEKLLPDLKLAEKELKQVKELLEKGKKEAQKILAEAREKNVDREEIRKVMEKAHEEIFKGLKMILTEEQFKKVEKAMQDAPRGGSGGPPGTPRPVRPGGERPPE